MSVQEVIRPFQQEQAVYNNIERDNIVAWQCMKPHFKDECTFESSVVQKPLVYRDAKKSRAQEGHRMV